MLADTVSKLIPVLIIFALLGIALFALLGIALRMLPSRIGTKSTGFPYKARPYFFSPAERSFLGVIEQVLDDEFRVFGKVNLYDIVLLQAPRDTYRAALNRIQNKHVDYVICRKDDLSIRALIELDDKSHLSAKRKERDRFLDETCRHADIRLIRVKAKKAYSLAEIVGVLKPYSAPKVYAA